MKEENALREALIAFLRTDAERLTPPGGVPLTRVEAQQRLQELIPSVIEVRSVCAGARGVVAAAPHVSFDNWSEYFCNRAALKLGLGRVVAKHFRDQDRLHIPVSIGRHIHVNRPAESAGPGEPERETDRAREAYNRYAAALNEAGGGVWPLNLLLEFHSHRQTPDIEIATCGFDQTDAAAMLDEWSRLRTEAAGLPELRIEPLHQLRFSALAAKRNGSLRPEVCRRALHIELPRAARRSEDLRQMANKHVLAFLDALLKRLNL